MRFKQVFVVGTGRCGSLTFMKACEHFTNYTTAHEGAAKKCGKWKKARYWELDYPQHHIEVDARLSWMLGLLDKKYGDEAFYVHLIRDRDEVINSRKLRVLRKWGKMTQSLAKFWYVDTPEDEAFLGALYDIIVANINTFLAHKTHRAIVRVGEHAKADFRSFCEAIGAEGDIEGAVSEWDIRHHQSPELR
jgi:hypothetical protein